MMQTNCWCQRASEHQKSRSEGEGKFGAYRTFNSLCLLQILTAPRETVGNRCVQKFIYLTPAYVSRTFSSEGESTWNCFHNSHLWLVPEFDCKRVFHEWVTTQKCQYCQLGISCVIRKQAYHWLSLSSLSERKTTTFGYCSPLRIAPATSKLVNFVNLCTELKLPSV